MALVIGVALQRHHRLVGAVVGQAEVDVLGPLGPDRDLRQVEVEVLRPGREALVEVRDGPCHLVLGEAHLLGNRVGDRGLEALAGVRVVVVLARPRMSGPAREVRRVGRVVGADRELPGGQRLQAGRRAVGRSAGAGRRRRAGRRAGAAAAGCGHCEGDEGDCQELLDHLGDLSKNVAVEAPQPTMERVPGPWLTGHPHHAYLTRRATARTSSVASSMSPGIDGDSGDVPSVTVPIGGGAWNT